MSAFVAYLVHGSYLSVLSRLVPEEHHWEAPPPRQDLDESAMDTQEEDGLEKPAETRGRETVEKSIRQQVYVDYFPLATAGAPIKHSQEPASAHSDAQPSPAEGNPYAPFKSRMDWEIARWAKLRGPGSTAITELLDIAGVCVSFSIHVLNTYENFSCHSFRMHFIYRIRAHES